MTQDVDFVVSAHVIERAVSLLEQAGFRSERFEWSVDFKGRAAGSLQLRTESFCSEFPSGSVPADVHGILLRVASLPDTLSGKIKAWSEPARRQCKRLEDLADIARLVEAHPQLWDSLPDVIEQQLQCPETT